MIHKRLKLLNEDNAFNETSHDAKSFHKTIIQCDVFNTAGRLTSASRFITKNQNDINLYLVNTQ